MPTQRKYLGNYEVTISNYLRTKNKILTPQGLNNALGIDRKYIFDCRRRSSPWQRNFLKSYDKARSIISTHMLEKALVKPEIIYQHWLKSHPNEFDINEEDNNTQSNIIINIIEPRKIENND
ncbi:hypothetical protein [Spiroplasma sp. AdecLV25b]|uniref:hypothetical protein n=1 Tax=Spiroplasma sp. AdecLV25b TaxID=3027162 RepID=UPI0027DEACBC|nr:hypothetical protein [Spiroplasma sp. AdecLV25b]